MNIQVYGKNAVRATLEADNAKTLFTLKRLEKDELVAMARKKGIPVKFVEEKELTGLAKNPSHQGFLVLSEAIRSYSLEEVLQSIPSEKKYPLIVILDGIEDPHNLGAIIRTCDAFSVDGIIMKKRGEVPLNGTVAKVSTGAINYVKVAVVANLNQAIEKLKQNGYWVVSSDGSATQNYLDVDYNSPIALVVGSEGFGISKLVLKNSDFIVKIPMTGHVNSLNASVASAILISGVVASRSKK